MRHAKADPFGAPDIDVIAFGPPVFTTGFPGKKDRSAHELIIDCRPFKEKGIEVVDIVPINISF